MRNPAARLIARYGSPPEDEYTLQSDTTNLGREPFNDIVLNYPEVSRRHARIVVQEGGYLLEDLNSTNGTFVNGRRLDDALWLEDGDEISLAEAVGFTFVVDDDSAHTVPLSQPSSLETAVEHPHARVYAAAEEAVVPTPQPATEYEFDYDYPEDDYAEDEVVEPLVATPTSEERRSGCGRWIVGCLLLLLILTVGCFGTLFVLDAQFPNLLYCGSMEPLIQFIADVLTLLGVGNYQPLPCPIV